MSDSPTQHIPVLVKEVCEHLPAPIKDGLAIVDGTFGYGGHFKAIKSFLGSKLKSYIGIDQDARALHSLDKEVRILTFKHPFVISSPFVIPAKAGIHTDNAIRVDLRLRGDDKEGGDDRDANRQGSDVQQYPELTLVLGSFRKMDMLLPAHTCVDAIILDLGVSTPMLTTGGRGMSFQQDEPLDMRISPEFHSDSAVGLIRKLSVDELSEAIRILTPLRAAHKIALALKDFVADDSVPKTTHALLSKINPLLPHFPGRRTHPATTLFMMLRILVNDEVGALEEGIPRMIPLLRPGGRLLIISFHGFEHRLVKRLLMERSAYGKILNRKPICPSRQECMNNPSARSAQLRVFEVNSDSQFTVGNST